MLSLVLIVWIGYILMLVMLGRLLTRHIYRAPFYLAFASFGYKDSKKKFRPQFLIVQRSETTSGGILLLCSEPRLQKCSPLLCLWDGRSQAKTSLNLKLMILQLEQLETLCIIWEVGALLEAGMGNGVKALLE